LSKITEILPVVDVYCYITSILSPQPYPFLYHGLFSQQKKQGFPGNDTLRSYSYSESPMIRSTLFQAFSALSTLLPLTSILPSPHALRIQKRCRINLVSPWRRVIFRKQSPG